MIVSYRRKGLDALYGTASTKGVQAAHGPKLLRILAALDTAARAHELNQPAFRLHPLKGELRGRWAIWVSGNWRVTFRFAGTNVELLDDEDYR